MNDKKKEKLKANLVKAGLMEQTDTIIDCQQVNYVDRLVGRIGQWQQGWVYFTQEQLICPTGFLNEDIVIPYKNIREIGKFSHVFLPMGMAVTYKDSKTGRMVTEKFIISKRGKWMNFLAEKAGI